MVNQAALDALEAMLAEATRPSPLAGPSRDLDPRLHGYQRRAVEHLWANPRAGLLLEMGLGKSAAVLQALTPEHLPVLVIAPKRVAENVWTTERAKWRPDLSIAVAAGTPARRAKALDSRADIIVIGRDNIKDVEQDQFRTVVLDELSSFKNRQSQRWKFARKITAGATYVWGLTGTPAPNGMMDLWAQIALLDSGERLGKTLTAYRSRYFRPGRQLPTGVIIEWILRDGAQAKIEQKLSDICLSMKAIDHLDLPPVTRNIIRVPLDAKTTKVYEQMQQTLMVDLASETHTAANAAVLTNKLSQIAAGFLYPDTDTDGEISYLNTAKADAVVEVVEGTGSPVLVFYRFREELAQLKKALPQARNIDEKGVLEAWDRGQVPVLLAHPASAGHGLNLQAGGFNVVWSTLPPFDLEMWDQANARLARQGQTNPVVIHILQAASVDEAILAKLDGKADLQEAVMRALKGQVALA